MTYIRKEGWLWPASDTIAWPVLLQEAARIPDILAHVPRKGTAVQAGGHCGLIVRQIADAFETVYTFEPHPQNFVCLVNNVPDRHVCKIQACLGASGSGPVSLSDWGDNTSASYVGTDESLPHFRPVVGALSPVLTLDSLNLPSLDLLMLDVEGFEYQALEGAKETIAKHHPVIVLELVGHGKRYGVADSDVRAKMKWHGYAEVARFERDSVFTFNGG